MSGQHAKFSPSSAHRVVTCPASLRHNQGHSPPSWFAVEGTIAHYIHALCLDSGAPARSFLGKVPARFMRENEMHDDEWALVPDGWTPDLDFCDAVQRSVDWILELAGPGADIKVENRVDISAFTPEGNQFGTCDVGIITAEGRLIICDLKFGRGVRVDAHLNHQLTLYALGFLERYGWMDNFTDVEVCVSQPRIDHFDSWSTTVGELLAFGAKIKEGFALAISDNPPYNPDEHACKFCQYKAECPALYKVVMEMFDSAPAEPATLPPADTSAILGKRKLIRDYLDAVEDHAASLLMHGKPVPGYKLVAGRSARKWAVDENEVANAINRAGFKAYTESLISPAQADKLAKGKFDSIIRKEEGNPTLAEESDKRAAWENTHADLFDTLKD